MRNLSCEEQLAQVNQDFEDFIYIVSHDFKAPIRAINNITGWISEDIGENISEEVKQNLRLLRNRTKRMEFMMDAILKLSRITRHELDIRELLLPQFLEEVKTPLEKAGVVIQIFAKSVSLTTYYKKLQFVLAELIKNAVAYSDKLDILISIYTEETENSVIFRVQDNGPGIPVRAADKIFTMFFTRGSKNDEGKLGVGLTLVKRILDFVGGAVRLEKNDPGNCIFLVEWPKLIN